MNEKRKVTVGDTYRLADGREVVIVKVYDDDTVEVCELIKEGDPRYNYDASNPAHVLIKVHKPKPIP